MFQIEEATNGYIIVGEGTKTIAPTIEEAFDFLLGQFVSDEECNSVGIVMSPVNVETCVVPVRLLCGVLAPLPAPACSVRTLTRSFINSIPETVNILLGYLGRGKMRFGHGLNLLYRSVLWNGSIGAQPSFEPA